MRADKVTEKDVPPEDGRPKMLTDEELKAKLTGGPDDMRNAQAFDANGRLDPELRPRLAHFYQPTEADLAAHTDKMMPFLQKGGHVLIPMREHRPVVRNVLNYLVTRVDPSRIIVVNCNSTDDALTAVVPFMDDGVMLVHHNEMLDMIDWDQLLPIMALDERPREGKGVTVLAGMLAMYLLFPRAAAIVQHDADVREAARYDPLAHLAYPLAKRPRGHRYLAVKISRPGRGNETSMTTRNILGDLATNLALSANVRKTAALLHEMLREHKWMLTGEFGLFGKVAYNRPFATGYCEETLISIFIESCIAYHTNGHPEHVAQVEAIFNRLDDANDSRKEFRMMDRISRFLVEYTLFGKPITSWTRDHYRRFNERFGSLTTLARIPSIEDGAELSGPVIVENVTQDRIIPSVKQLWEAGWVDRDKAAAFRARYRV